MLAGRRDSMVARDGNGEGEKSTDEKKENEQTCFCEDAPQRGGLFPDSAAVYGDLHFCPESAAVVGSIGKHDHQYAGDEQPDDGLYDGRSEAEH